MAQKGNSTNSNVSWLKPGQVEAMRDAAHDGLQELRDEAILTILYDTGLRRAELSAVNQEMLDLDDELLRLPAGIQKDYPTDGGPDDTTIALDLEGDLRTVRTLRAYTGSRDDDSPALFPCIKSDQMTGKAINDVVHRAAEQAEVRPHVFDERGMPSDASSHTLRHSVAYRLLNSYSGYTLYNVRNRLRHSRLATTEEKYDHFDAV